MGINNQTVYFNDSRWNGRLDVPPVVVSAGIKWHGHNGDERYFLPNLWCLHMYRYDSELILDTGVYQIHYGKISIIPPNIPIHFRYEHLCEHLYVHFALETATAIQYPIVFPVMMALGTDFDGLYNDMAEVAGNAVVSSYRLRSRFWDLLCRLTNRFCEQYSADDARLHPIVRRAQELIERRISTAINVTNLAEEVDVSPGYLVKLFRNGCGMTVVEYIRRRRLEYAVHLIGNTTMSIKAIAVATGMPDLHHFNKVVHRGFGLSPREMRRHAYASASFEEPSPMFWTDTHASEHPE